MWSRRLCMCVSVPRRMPTLLHVPGCNSWECCGLLPSCALLDGFAIGARVSLLWQHSRQMSARTLILAVWLVTFVEHESVSSFHFITFSVFLPLPLSADVLLSPPFVCLSVSNVIQKVIGGFSWCIIYVDYGPGKIWLQFRSDIEHVLDIFVVFSMDSSGLLHAVQLLDM